MRPRCGRCQSKSLDCEWEVEQGVGRYTALKSRNAKLEQDLASLRELYRQIQVSPLNEAIDLVERIRSNPDITPSRISAAEGSGHLKSNDGNAQTTPAVLRPEAELFTVQDAAIVAPAGGEAVGLTLERGKASTKATFALTAPPSGTHAIYQRRISALMSGFEAFFRCTGSLFYVYTEEEGDSLQQDVLKHLSPTDWLDGDSQGVESEVAISFAEMCGMSAIGLQYTIEPIPAMGYTGSKADGSFEFTGDFYRIAKQLLDEAIGFNPLRAMKLCTLLSLYNIIAHSSVALAYAGLSLYSGFWFNCIRLTSLVEMGISLGEHHGMQYDIHVIGLSRDNSADYRRVLRTLITLRR